MNDDLDDITAEAEEKPDPSWFSRDGIRSGRIDLGLFADGAFATLMPPKRKHIKRMERHIDDKGSLTEEGMTSLVVATLESVEGIPGLGEMPDKRDGGIKAWAEWLDDMSDTLYQRVATGCAIFRSQLVKEASGEGNGSEKQSGES